MNGHKVRTNFNPDNDIVVDLGSVKPYEPED